jgi:hypothetical protein
MTTFAEIPDVLPDGQVTVTACPEEIVQRGFFPPVQTQDGRVIKGDVLPSAWLNDLIRKAYKPATTEITDAMIPDNFEAPGTADGIQGSFTFTVGGLVVEIGAYRRATATPTQGLIKFKGPFALSVIPHLYMLDLSDPTVITGKYSLWHAVNSSSGVNGVAFAAKALVRTDTNALPGTFLYIAIGEIQGASLRQAAPTFCSEPQNFIDGQTSFSAPTVEQLSYGFAPPVLSGTTILEGDTLPANVLNYLLHDITSNKNAFYWEKAVESGTNRTRYRLVIGDMQIESYRTDIAATDPTVSTFPWAFADSATDSDIFTMANAAQTASPSFASASAISATQCNVTNRRVDVAAAAAAIAGTVTVLAIGPAPANIVRKPSLVPALSSFADQNRTYADGQANRVKPSDEVMQAGFLPTFKNDTGIIVHGDFVTANELNWLFNDLYKMTANTKMLSGKIAANAATKVTGGGWVSFGAMLVQWYTVKGLVAGDWPSNVHNQIHPMPFKTTTKPAVFAVDVSVDVGSRLLVTVADREDHTSANIGAFRLADGAASQPTNIRVMVIGKKP